MLGGTKAKKDRYKERKKGGSRRHRTKANKDIYRRNVKRREHRIQSRTKEKMRGRLGVCSKKVKEHKGYWMFLDMPTCLFFKELYNNIL